MVPQEEEIANEMSGMESRLANKVDEQIRSMQQDIEKEKKSRALLETRFQHFEQKEGLKYKANNIMGDGTSTALIGENRNRG